MKHFVQMSKLRRGAESGNSVPKIFIFVNDNIFLFCRFKNDPNDYNKLLQPIIDNKADIVYGSRFKGDGPQRTLVFLHTSGNKFLTFLSNLFTGLKLTDMETCYKAFKADIASQITIKENRFGFEPEITAKISRIKNVRVSEIPISYQARTYATGKKIKWTDGFHAIWCILKYNILSRK